MFDLHNSSLSFRTAGYLVWLVGLGYLCFPGFPYDMPHPERTTHQNAILAAMLFVVGLALILVGKKRERRAIENAALVDALGLKYQKAGQYESAIMECDQAIAANPDDVRAFLRRGFARFNCGQFDRAIADFDEAIRLNPRDGNAFHCRGLIWHKKRLYNRAIQDFDEAIRLEPDDVTIFADRGRAWRAKDESSVVARSAAG